MLDGINQNYTAIAQKIKSFAPWACKICVLGWPLSNICVTNDVNSPRSFPHSWLITGFVTRLTRRVPLVEQELLTLPEHPSSLF